MWRYLAGGLAALLLASAGLFWFTSGSANRGVQRILPAFPQTAEDPGGLPDSVPEADPKTREQKRFGRVDKDKDGNVTRDEYLMPRRKAFAKLDTNGDGKLDFDEWAIKATTKFAGADKDKSGALTPAEFATTAVVRKARPKAKCACPPVAAAPAGADDEN